MSRGAALHAAIAARRATIVRRRFSVRKTQRRKTNGDHVSGSSGRRVPTRSVADRARLVDEHLVTVGDWEPDDGSLLGSSSRRSPRNARPSTSARYAPVSPLEAPITLPSKLIELRLRPAPNYAPRIRHKLHSTLPAAVLSYQHPLMAPTPVPNLASPLPTTLPDATLSSQDPLQSPIQSLRFLHASDAPNWHPLSSQPTRMDHRVYLAKSRSHCHL